VSAGRRRGGLHAHGPWRRRRLDLARPNLVAGARRGNSDKLDRRRCGVVLGRHDGGALL
jgi:hypothetical protein